MGAAVAGVGVSLGGCTANGLLFSKSWAETDGRRAKLGGRIAKKMKGR